MALHSSTLAWKIPWMEEPGGLQSTGSPRVRHNWVTEQQQHSWFTMIISAVQHGDLVCVYIYIRESNGTPLQYSCLENPMDGGAWWAAVHGVGEGWTRLSDSTLTFHFCALEKEMATHSSVLA